MLISKGLINCHSVTHHSEWDRYENPNLWSRKKGGGVLFLPGDCSSSYTGLPVSPPLTSTPSGLNTAKKGPETVWYLRHPLTQNLGSKRSPYSNINALHHVVHAMPHVFLLPSVTPASQAFPLFFKPPGVLLPQDLCICYTLHLRCSSLHIHSSFPHFLTSFRCLLKCRLCHGAFPFHISILPALTFLCFFVLSTFHYQNYSSYIVITYTAYYLPLSQECKLRVS